MPLFKLILQKTYYRQGFFNVTVDFDRFVRSTEGPVGLVLGKSRDKIEGKINRSANRNGTARIMGGAKLRDWFCDTHKLGDVVDIDLSSFDPILIGATCAPVTVESNQDRSAHKSPGGEREVTADELSRWRRAILRLLDALDHHPQVEDGLAGRISRLSRSGRIPRETAALMKAVTEMRNVSEYEAKRPSKSESAAIRNAWASVVEWASSIGIDIGAAP